MVCVVTGGCGFIGSHLVEELLARGNEVSVVDIKPWKYDSHPNLEIINHDIREPLAFLDVDKVFHLAALADIIPSIENPIDYYETNVTGTLNVLEAARRAKCKKFIYAASSSCYGAPDETAEYDDCDPQYPYALTKYMGEQLALHWDRVYKLPAVSMRLFNVYGLRHRTNGTYGAMFGTFLAQLANGKPLTIVGDGTQKRDFVHVSDVVMALIMASDSDCTGVYNVGTGSPIQINHIAKLLGANNIINIPERPGEPHITHADILKIKRDMGWKPTVSIEDGVDELLRNMFLYKDAPVFSPEMIEEATKSWFEALA